MSGGTGSDDRQAFARGNRAGARLGAEASWGKHGFPHESEPEAGDIHGFCWPLVLSKPLNGSASYGNVEENGTAVASTPSPSGRL
jgi:hypothetical protein